MKCYRSVNLHRFKTVHMVIKCLISNDRDQSNFIVRKMFQVKLLAILLKELLALKMFLWISQSLTISTRSFNLKDNSMIARELNTMKSLLSLNRAYNAIYSTLIKDMRKKEINASDSIGTLILQKAFLS